MAVATRPDERRLTSDERAYLRELGGRLRQIRRSRGWTLDAAIKNGCLISASGLGAFERATRTPSVEVAAYLAEFYEVPLGYLLSGENSSASSGVPRRLCIDLKALDEAVEEAAPLRRLVRSIEDDRRSWNATEITLRSSDLIAVAALIGAKTPDAGIRQLEAWGVLREELIG